MTRLLLLMWLLTVGAMPFSTAAAAQPTGPDFDEMDRFVQSHMQNRGIPGVAVTVIRGDQVVHQRGFGVADSSGRPVTPQTLFRIGSNSKSFTALAIMQLVEQGRIDLDAPAQRYLPWFRLADAEASAQITVAQLLYHTSSIPGSALYDSFTDAGLALEQYVRDLSTIHPNRPVGSGYEYSNANYNVAGLIVEAVSGQSYATYIEQHIFEPLQMTRSTASVAAERRNGPAQGHSWMFGLGPFPADDPFSAANLPAGYLSSTAEDLSHYMLAQLNGGRYGSAQILSAEGIARMHLAGPNTQNFNPSGGYGLGWGVGVSNGVRIVDHTGETMKFVSRQFMDIDNGWGLIVLTNATNPLPSDGEPYRTLARGLITRIEGWPPAPEAPSIHTQYAVLNAVLAVLSVAILVSAANLPRWSASMQARVQGGLSRLRLALSGVRIALEIAIPLAVLVLGPSLMQPGISWRTLLVSTPDVGWWALYFSGLLLITGLTRAVLLAAALWRNPRVAARVPALQPSAS